MTADQLAARDARIHELSRLGAARTDAQRDEQLTLELARDQQWRRLSARIRAARQRAADLEAYARQIGLPLEMETV